MHEIHLMLFFSLQAQVFLGFNAWVNQYGFFPDDKCSFNMITGMFMFMSLNDVVLLFIVCCCICICVSEVAGFSICSGVK